MQSRLPVIFAVLLWLIVPAFGQQNLARQAHASASEFQPGLPAELGNDGNEETRWSGIPGHNSGVWYELEWDHPVQVGEVLVRQFQRFTFEWDVQVWDESADDWRTVQHFGKPGEKLPGIVLCTIQPPVTTTKVRIANITNGPSFTEVEVYASARAHPPVISLASDLRGNFVGMICDGFGSQPIASKGVRLDCQTAKSNWTAYAVTDAHGLFFAQMPVGLTGRVTAVADGIDPHHFDSAKFQRAITPLDMNLRTTELSRGWLFKTDPPRGFEQPSFDDAGWLPIKVPAHWEMEGFKSLNGIGGYRLHFRAPSGAGRLMLRFDGVYSGADVWINGKHLAHHEGGFTPFEMDATDAAVPGDNVLALRVVEHTNTSDNLDKMSLYADFGLAGIMRKVTMFRLPAIHVESYEQSCALAGAATVAGKLSIVNCSPRSASVSAEVSLEASDGRVVARTSLSAQEIVSLARGEVAFHLTVPGPHPWNAEHPYLYTLRFELKQAGRVVQTLRQKIGLRETSIEGSSLLIDGKPVKIRGTCHHDQYPTMGRAVTPEIERNDVKMIKQANLNSLRTSHYPPMPELVQAADELGLYVEDEADFCWVGVADDLRNAPQIIQLTGELIARDRNHPSVFMWSLCNESDFGYDFERSHEWVRQIDPSRPTSAATSAWLEIATLHNPIATGRIQETENIGKPMLFDEAWCIYQGIFGDVAEMWVDPGIRDYYAEPLKAIWDAFQKSKTTQGSQIWAWSDDLFCVPNRGLEYGRETTQSHFVEGTYLMPGKGITGDAPWGVVDGWRRQKPEFWITKHLQSPVKMREGSYVPGEPTRIAVTNEYDFTNLSDLIVKYQIGSVTGRLRANIAPRSSGEITVPASYATGPLVITVVDAYGNVVDKFAFPEKAPVAKESDGPPLVVRDESILAGDSTHVIGGNFEIAFDKGTGAMRECVRNSQPLLLEFPSIHVLPANAPMREIPDRLGWKLTSMTVKPTGKNVQVTLNGQYPDLEGRYELTITPGGAITVKSHFVYTGARMLAREVGMRFSVPKGCSQLAWDRIAEWNSFPEDHIGRPKGVAFAVYDHPQAVPPTWPYAQDNSPMGSNDFRSTKRHIRSGAITYATGAGIGIQSDGTQALRAIIDTDRVTVHVSDWYGGTNVGWGEWITNYGRGKVILKGDTLESTLRVQLLSGQKATATKVAAQGRLRSKRSRFIRRAGKGRKVRVRRA